MADTWTKQRERALWRGIAKQIRLHREHYLCNALGRALDSRGSIIRAQGHPQYLRLLRYRPIVLPSCWYLNPESGSWWPFNDDGRRLRLRVCALLAHDGPRPKRRKQ